MTTKKSNPSSKFGVAVDYRLHLFKEVFFSNDRSVLKYSSLFFLIPIVVWFWGYLWGSEFSFLSIWKDIEITTTILDFISLWLGVCGVTFAILVMLNINIKKTKTGSDFLHLITSELSSLKEGETITIITPNINIGAYYYRDESKFIKNVEDARRRGVTVKFITLTLLSEDLDKCINSNTPQMIMEGCGSGQLKYLYDRYICPIVKKEEAQRELLKKRGSSSDDIRLSPLPISSSYVATNTATALKNLVGLLDERNIHGCERKVFDQNSIVGYFTENCVYVAQIHDYEESLGHVIVIGEKVEHPTLVQDYVKVVKTKFECPEDF